MGLGLKFTGDNASTANNQQQTQSVNTPTQKNNGSGIWGGLLSGITDIFMGERNANRQWKREKEASEIQLENQKNLNKFNQDLQYQMWEKTNYSEQVNQLEKAGLNAGLLYGMSGGGGTTTGQTGGGASAPNAPTQQNQPTGMAMQTGIQLAMMESQKNLIDAQTNKTNIEAAKTAGIDTDLGKGHLKGLGLDNTLKEETLDYKINQAFSESRKSIADADISSANANIANNTIAEKIQGFKLDNLIKATENALKQSGIKLNEATIKNMAEQIKLGKFNSNQSAEYKGVNQVLGGALNKIINTIAAMIGLDDDMFIDKTK